MRAPKSAGLWLVRLAAPLFLAFALHAAYVQAVTVTRASGHSGMIYGHMVAALSMLKGRAFDLAGYSDILPLLSGQMLPENYDTLRAKLPDVKIDPSKVYLVAGEFGSILYYYFVFRVFGINANAVETGWIAIVAFSALLYFLAFFKDRSALALLAMPAAAFLIFNEYSSVRFFGYFISRLSPALALIPFLHIYWSLRQTVRLTVFRTLLLFLQSVILVFWILYRTNSLAYLGLVTLAFVVLALGRLWPSLRASVAERRITVDPDARRWLAAKSIVVGTPLACYAVVMLVLIPAIAHPDYKTYPYHHLFWHPLVVGMACEGKDPCLGVELTDKSAFQIARASRFNRWGDTLEYGPNYEWVLRQEYMQCVKRSPAYYAAMYWRRAGLAFNGVILPEIRLGVATRSGTGALLTFIAIFALFYRGPVRVVLFGTGGLAAITFLACLMYCADTVYLGPAAFSIILFGLAIPASVAAFVARSLVGGREDAAN